MSDRVFVHKDCGGLAYTVSEDGFYSLAHARQPHLGVKVRLNGRRQYPYGVAVDCLCCGKPLPIAFSGNSHHVGVEEEKHTLRSIAMIARHTHRQQCNT
jgi:hypothetical protein